MFEEIKTSEYGKTMRRRLAPDHPTTPGPLRPKLDTSLPSSILPLLDHIGVGEAFKAVPWRRSTRAVVWWADTRPSLHEQPGPVCHVDRGRFDQLLLDHAARFGVTVFKPARAAQARRLADGGWRITIASALRDTSDAAFVHHGIPTEIESRFIVDASGGTGWLPGRWTATAPPLLALYAEWFMRDGAAPETCVEAGDNAWFWFDQLDEGRAVVAVFTDPARLRRHTPSGGATWLEAVYCDLLSNFRLFGAWGARLAGRVQACAAGSQSAEDLVGQDFIRVGDASVRLDPLSSQGVQSAVLSGIQAAAVINTLARHAEHGEAALAFYRDRQREHAARHARKTAAFYRERSSVCADPFWKHRAAVLDYAESEADGRSPQLPDSIETSTLDTEWTIGLSPRANIVSTPAMYGDVIRLAPAVQHETWKRPVAFVDSVDIGPLLALIQPGQRVRSVLDGWGGHLAPETAWRTMEWLWKHHVLVRTGNDKSQTSRRQSAEVQSQGTRTNQPKSDNRPTDRAL